MSITIRSRSNSNSESACIKAFIDARVKGDRKLMTKARRRLLQDGFSSDAEMLVAFVYLSDEFFLNSAMAMQRALERRIEEWSALGRVVFRPEIQEEAAKAIFRLQQMLKTHPNSPGVRWLQSLILAHKGEVSKAVATAKQLDNEELPKWFRCHVRMLAKNLESTETLPARQSAPKSHWRLVSGVSCPLMKGNGETQCLASSVVDALSEPGNPEFCAGKHWEECPHFSRFRVIRCKAKKNNTATKQAFDEIDKAYDAEQYDRVVELARKGMQDDPLEDQFYFMCALALRSLKDFAESYRTLSIAAKLVPNQPVVFTTLSALAMELEQPMLGQWLAERALALDDKNAVALNNMAESLKLQGRRADAVRYYRLACEADTQNTEMQRALVLSLSWLGKWEDAAKETEELQKRLGEKCVYGDLIASIPEQLAEAQTLKQEAARHVEEIGTPQQAFTYYGDNADCARYGRDLLLTDKVELCGTLLQQIASQSQASPAIPLLQGASLFLRRKTVQDLEKAATLFEKALSQFGENDTVFTDFGFMVVRTYFLLEKYEKALEWARHFVSIDPSNEMAMIPQLRNLLGHSKEEIEKETRSLTWRCIRGSLIPAVAMCSIPLILIMLIPFPVWAAAILSAGSGFGMIPLLRLVFAREIPKSLHETFGNWVAGLSAAVVALFALFWVGGILGRIIAVVWYGFASILPGANFDESSSGQNSSD